MRSCFPAKTVSILVFCLLLLLFISHTALAKNQATPAAYSPGEMQYCPKGKPYLHSSCSPVRLTMSSAITDARNAAADGVSGTIFIEAGGYGGSVIDISGFDYGTSLTIQGGVNGGTTTFTRQLSVQNNLGLNFTLRDVTISHSAPAESGLYVLNHTGNISLVNTPIIVGAGNGIYIYNLTGNVSMNNVWADGNANMGIGLISITGNVKLDHVTANGNNNANIVIDSLSGDASYTDVQANNSFDSYGVYLENIHGKKGVTLTGIEALNNKQANIQIGYVNNNVSLKDIYAHDSLSGVNGYGVYIHEVHGKKGVALQNVNANNNEYGNVRIEKITGNTSLVNINANLSHYSGIYCGEINGVKGVSMKNVTANNNGQNNLAIKDVFGSINIIDVQANSSVLGYGILLQNVQGSKGVTAKNVSANGNSNSNLIINLVYGGNVTMNNIQANSSGTNTGLYITQVQGSKGVTLKNVVAHNNAVNNITIDAVYNNANLMSISALGGGGYGIDIASIEGIKGVSLKNAAAIANHDSNIYLHDISGNVSLTGITALNSITNFGIHIENIYGSKGVTFKDIHSNTNSMNNLTIDFLVGSINFSGVKATGSGARGIYINNIQGSKGVVLSNINASNNDVENLDINNVTSNVSLSMVEANGSVNDRGIDISSVAGSKGVVLKNVIAQGNSGDNIFFADINPGDVILNRVTASDSGLSHGCFAINVSGQVMVLNSFFNNNHSNGLMTNNADGLILLKGVQANDNNDDGANLDSDSNQLVCSSELINNTDFSIRSTTIGNSLTLSNVIFDNLMFTGAGWTTNTKCAVIPPP